MTTKSLPTWWVKIYIAGALPVIEQVCREECDDVGLCVTVEPLQFIYTGGAEFGACVGLIAYPRFPQPRECVTGRATILVHRLLSRLTDQNKVLVMNPEQTILIER